MVPLTIKSQALRSILREEIPLSGKARYAPPDILEGTQLFAHSFGTIADGGITYILVRGTFVTTDTYVLMKADLPDDFRFPAIVQELEAKGLDPAKTRIICVAVNTPGDEPHARLKPEIQIFRIPF